MRSGIDTNAQRRRWSLFEVAEMKRPDTTKVWLCVYGGTLHPRHLTPADAPWRNVEQLCSSSTCATKSYAIKLFDFPGIIILRCFSVKKWAVVTILDPEKFPCMGEHTAGRPTPLHPLELCDSFQKNAFGIVFNADT